jgi:NTP pyrophosphatase (non-canonical NTP hydrolase)
MGLDEFQKKAVGIIDKVDNKTNFNHDINSCMIHLIEEFGEIARQVMNEKLGRNNGLDKENLGEELVDCMLFISKLADHYNIDLEKSFEFKIEKLKKKWDMEEL